MKQKLRLFSTLLLLAVVSAAWGEEVTASFDVSSYANSNNWTNQQQYLTANVGDVTFAVSGGSTLNNSGKYYNSDNSWRFYANEGAKLTISVPEGNTIVSVTPTFTIKDNGTLLYNNSACTSGEEVAVTGNSVDFTISQSSGNKGKVFLTAIEVKYTNGGDTPSTTSAVPTISGDESFVNNTTVTLSAADGASIYYTMNGDEPTTSSTLYESPFTLTETTTVKAIAVEEGKEASAVAEKTFTKVEALANLAALTSKTEAGSYYVTLSNAVVTYVNGNYAYIQDASGAIVMYKSGHGLTAGQVLNGTANVTYQLRNSNPQLTDLSGVTITDGTAPEPTEVAASTWNSTISAELSKYYKITGATVTYNNNKYYITLGSETVQLYGQGNANPVSVSDLEATYTVIGFPTIYNTTPELQIFEQPTAETVTRQELSMTFTGGTLEFTDASDFVAPTLSITDESGTSVSGLTITYESSNPSVANVDDSGNVTIGSEYGTATITATFAGNDDYVPASATYTLTYTNSSQGSYTWDLSKASYDANPSEDLVTWSSNFATMTNAKGSGTSAANNYLGGDSNNRTSSRFYKGNILTITPAASYSISSAVFTATSENYADALANSTWTNATATTSGTTVTVIPTDGTSVISAVIGATCGFTGVTVSYIKDERANAEIAFSTESLTITQGKDYTAPTFSNPNNVAVTFATDHAEVASWNNGFVLGTATGTAVITATFEGNDNYMPATATLTVTVKEDLNFVEVTEGCGIYQKVTSASDLEAGKRYLMVYENEGTAVVYNGQHGTDSYAGKVDGTITNNMIDNTTLNAVPVVLQNAGSGNWYLLDGNNFLYWPGGNALEWTDDVNESDSWTIDVENGQIINAEETTRRLQYNSGSPRFACYTGTQKDVVLYKELTEAPQPEIITVSVNALATDGNKFYSTLYYSDKNLKIPAGITASGVSVNGKSLVMDPVLAEDDVIAKGKAVLLTANAAGDYEFTVVADTEVDDNISWDANLLRGNDEEATTEGGEGNWKYYKLTTKGGKNLGFYFGAEDGAPFTNGAHKAYLAVPAGQAPAKGFVLGEETDGIRQIENGELTIENAEIYNLSGQRVNKAQKGVYIVNGKKVVIR